MIIINDNNLKKKKEENMWYMKVTVVPVIIRVTGKKNWKNLRSSELSLPKEKHFPKSARTTRFSENTEEAFCHVSPSY